MSLLRTAFFCALIGQQLSVDAQDSLARWKEHQPFSEDRAIVSGEHGYGHIDRSGKVIVPLQWELATAYSAGLAAVARTDNEGNTWWYFLNKQGKRAFQDSFSAVRTFFEESGNEFAFRNGLAYVTKKDKRYAIDASGGPVAELQENWKPPFVNGMIISGQDSALGVHDLKGKLIVPEKYRSVELLKNGLIVVEQKGKYAVFAPGAQPKLQYRNAKERPDGFVEVESEDYSGLVNRAGKLILPVEYDKIGPVSEGLISVRKNDRSGFADTTGKIRIPLTYAMAEEFRFGKALVKLRTGEKTFIDYNGKPVAPDYNNLPKAASLAEAERSLLQLLNRVATEYPYEAEAGKGGVETPFAISNGMLTVVLWRSQDGNRYRTRWTMPVKQISGVWLDLNMGFSLDGEAARRETATGDGAFAKDGQYDLVHLAAPGDGAAARRLRDELEIALMQAQAFWK